MEKLYFRDLVRLSQAGMKLKASWKRSWGDGYETDDTVLWVDGHPTSVCISPISGCHCAMVGNQQICIYDTIKECKSDLLEFMNRHFVAIA